MITLADHFCRTGGRSAEAIDRRFAAPKPADHFCRTAPDQSCRALTELSQAVAAGARIQLDSLDEIDALASVGARRDTRVSLRLSAPYHGRWSRFGFVPAELSEALARLERAKMSVSGVHLHGGSNIADPGWHAGLVRMHGESIKFLLARCAGTFVLDVGGGFPARSCGPDVRLPEHIEYAQQLARAIKALGIPRKRFDIVIEPGRCLVEDNGWLIASVVTRKQRSEQPLLVLDASGNLLRSCGRWYHEISFARVGNERSFVLVGSNCYESDLVAPQVPGPADLGPGDRVLIGQAGGYDMSTASGWIRPLPAVYGIDHGRTVLLRHAQMPDDLRRLEPVAERAQAARPVAEPCP